jgi:hypothetical protein
VRKPYAAPVSHANLLLLKDVGADVQVSLITMILQIATLMVAAVGPFLGYRFARKLFITQGRQTWINDLRSDLAELIALNDVAVGMNRELSKDELVDEYRVTMAKVQTLRMRIRLRLERGNERHDRLVAAIETMLKAVTTPHTERNVLRDDLLDAAEKVLQHVWKNMERGR